MPRSARNEGAQRPRDKVSHAPRRVTHRLRDSKRLVSVVAREELVAAVPSKGDGHLAARRFAKAQGGNRGGVGEGLVVLRDDLRQKVVRARLDEELRVIRSKELRGLARVTRFVVFLLREADRKGAHLLLAELTHEPRDDRGVDPCGEEGAKGDVASHSNAHGVFETSAQLARRFFIRRGRQVKRRGAVERPRVDGALGAKAFDILGRHPGVCVEISDVLKLPISLDARFVPFVP